MSQHRIQDDITKQVALGDPLDYGTDGIKADVIAESTSAAGVTIDGLTIKDGGIGESFTVTGTLTASTAVSTDTISEKTAATGVTVDSLLIKDGIPTCLGLVLDTGLINSAGNNIANATAITKPFTVISAANNAVGAILPVASAGKVIIVKNSAANGALVYPQVNSAINALGANNSIEIATTAAAIFIAYNSTLWYTVPVLPS